MNNDFLKKVKNIIIIIVVLLSIIFICLVILNNIKKEKNTYDPNYTVGQYYHGSSLLRLE